MPKKKIHRRTDKHGFVHSGKHLDDSPGKGDNRRPAEITREEYERRWALAFGSDDDEQE